MTVLIDTERLFELLDECVQERGKDYKYPVVMDESCIYVQNGEPSCIIGLALFKAGVPIDTIYGSEDKNTKALRIRHDLCGLLTSDALFFAKKVQRLQDSGAEWSSAVESSRPV